MIVASRLWTKTGVKGEDGECARERERAKKLRRAETRAQTNRKQAGGSGAFVLTVSQGNEREVC